MKLIILFFLSINICIRCFATEVLDFSPTAQFLENNSYEKIWSALNSKKVPKKNEPFFQNITSKEAPGFFGYHGSAQIFRVFQDIIRISLEEILKIPIREDFQFLRIPGDTDLDLESVDDFFQRHEKINNRGSLKSKQLLSLNIPLYAGYNTGGSCTICFFANSKYKAKDKVDIVTDIGAFFERLGATEKDAKHYAEAAEKLSSYLNMDQGIILQFFDNSYCEGKECHDYCFLDEFGYACEIKGVLIDDYIPSNYLLNEEPIKYPQLRLVLSNHSTMNPYSPLIINRYDNQDPAAVELWEKNLRKLIQTLPVDITKKEQFKKELLDMWLGEKKL